MCTVAYSVHTHTIHPWETKKSIETHSWTGIRSLVSNDLETKQNMMAVFVVDLFSICKMRLYSIPSDIRLLAPSIWFYACCHLIRHFAGIRHSMHSDGSFCFQYVTADPFDGADRINIAAPHPASFFTEPKPARCVCRLATFITSRPIDTNIHACPLQANWWWCGKQRIIAYTIPDKQQKSNLFVSVAWQILVWIVSKNLPLKILAVSRTIRSL